MGKLKLTSVPDDKPIKLTVELPGPVFRDLQRYADLMAHGTGQTIEPPRLIAPMLVRFMATDRVFTKAKRGAALAPQSASAAGSTG
jgi:hypothetical protein